MSHLHSHDQRAIVDPSVWESTEVGSAEGLAFQSYEAVKRSKVSSMRSSLFAKHANNKKQGRCDQETLIFHDSLVFQQAHDAEEWIESEFSFQCNSDDGDGRIWRALEYCEFGKANKKIWPKDVLAFFHNAIRCEIHDLTRIMISIRKLGCKLIVGNMVNFKVWWQTCSAIVLDYLDMEVKVLEPWIAIALDEQEHGNGNGNDEGLQCFQSMPKCQQSLAHCNTSQ